MTAGGLVGRAALVGLAQGALLYGAAVSLLTVLLNRVVGVGVRDALALLAACGLLYGLWSALAFAGVAALAALGGALRRRRLDEASLRHAVRTAAFLFHLVFGVAVADYGLTYDQLPFGEGRLAMLLWLGLRAAAVAALAAAAAWLLLRVLSALGTLRRRWGAAAALLVLWAALHVTVAVWPRAAAEPPELASVPVPKGPAPGPVVLVGLDGADWEALEPLLAAGEMPHLAGFLERAAWGPLLTLPDANSAVLWASIYTGYPPEVHRILDFYTLRFPGMAKGVYPYHRTFLKELARQLQGLGLAIIDPIQRDDLAVPLLWEIAATAGRSVGVVDGYYYSFPAPPLSGGQDFFLAAGSERFARAAGGGAAAAALPEAGLYARPPELLAEVAPALTGGELEWQTEALLTLIEDRGQPDLVNLYAHQPDAVFHGAWRFEEPGLYLGVDREEAARRDDVADVHRGIDRFLGRLLPRLDPGTTVVLASDHGQSPTPVHAKDTQHRHGPPGILALAGPGVRPGRMEGAEIHDVAPTLLHLLGLPVADDFAGAVLAEALADPGVPARVPSYRGLPVARAEAAPPDPRLRAEELERLKALGYIQ